MTRTRAALQLYWVGVLGLLSAAFVACDRAVIEGTANDTKGEALPGVVVTVEGGEAQAVTDALGRYKIPYEPGAVELVFMKTGYTPGRLVIEIAELRHVSARPVALWCLPQSPGAYLFEDYRYRPAAPETPKPFTTPDGAGIVHGIQRLPDLEETVFREPVLVVFKMPLYDVRLCRLSTVQAAPPEAASSAGADVETKEVWQAEAPLPVEVLPVDEPKRRLAQLRLFRPLESGVYAVHWGSLEGYASTDPRAFLFRVIDPAQADLVEESEAQSPETEGTEKDEG